MQPKGNAAADKILKFKYIGKKICGNPSESVRTDNEQIMVIIWGLSASFTYFSLANISATHQVARDVSIKMLISELIALI